MSKKNDKNLILLEYEPSDILTDRTSKNGTDYTAIVLPNGEWVFVWQGDWKTEIDRNKNVYENNKCEIYVVDKEEKEGKHFYNLEIIVPADPEVAEKLLKKKKNIAAKKRA